MLYKMDGFQSDKENITYIKIIKEVVLQYHILLQIDRHGKRYKKIFKINPNYLQMILNKKKNKIN